MNKEKFIKFETPIFVDVLIDHLKAKKVSSFFASKREIDFIKQHHEFCQGNISIEETPFKNRKNKFVKLTWKGHNL